jgi:hypothetical protein
MILYDHSRLECFGFPDPDEVCASEYRAICECLNDALESQDQEDPSESPADLIDAMLNEFVGWAQAMLITLDEQRGEALGDGDDADED